MNSHRLATQDYINAKKFYISYFDGRKHERESLERYETVFRLIQELNLSPKSQVLDLGCGSGVISTQLSKVFESTYALDFLLSPDMEVVRQRVPQIQLVEGQLPCLPLRDSCMDLVVFSEVLEHLHRQDQIPAIQSVARIVKKGGIVILTTPNPIGIRSLLFLPLRLLRQQRGKQPFGQPVENWVKPHELRRMVKAWFYIANMAGTSYAPPLTEKLPRPLSGYLHNISRMIGKKELLRSLGEYQYYVLRRL